jgi:hypothetical protein
VPAIGEPALGLLGRSHDNPTGRRADCGRFVGGAAGEAALHKEGLPVDALGPFDAHDLRPAKTASRQVLGVMNERAFECGSHIDQAGGLWSIKIEELNNRMLHSLHTKEGEYRQPPRLVL